MCVFVLNMLFGLFLEAFLAVSSMCNLCGTVDTRFWSNYFFNVNFQEIWAALCKYTNVCTTECVSIHVFIILSLNKHIV